MKKRRPAPGFKLIELLVVIAISANLTALKAGVRLGVENTGYFHHSYSYYGHVERWNERGPADAVIHPEFLTEDRLDSNRLLMSDNWFQWWSDLSWLYNHGKRGPSVHYPPPYNTGLPGLSGLFVPLAREARRNSSLTGGYFINSSVESGRLMIRGSSVPELSSRVTKTPNGAR